MNWLKQSALAVVAWHVSSVITVLQMAWAKVALPDSYNWIMDTLGGPVTMGWSLVCSVWDVAIDLINTS